MVATFAVGLDHGVYLVGVWRGGRRGTAKPEATPQEVEQVPYYGDVSLGGASPLGLRITPKAWVDGGFESLPEDEEVYVRAEAVSFRNSSDVAWRGLSAISTRAARHEV